MNHPHPQLHWIANFIWGIADDVLRDLYVRGKYRDVIGDPEYSLITRSSDGQLQGLLGEIIGRSAS